MRENRGQVSGYVYNVNNPEDYTKFFVGGSANYIAGATGGAIGTDGVYAEILGGDSWIAGSAGFSVTYYNQIQSDWVYGKADIYWYHRATPSYNPFNQSNVL